MIGERGSPLFSLLLGGLLLFTLYLITSRVTTNRARQRVIKSNGCKPTAQLPHKDPFFGIDAIRDALRAAKAKTFLEFKQKHYELYGSTFSFRFSTLFAISTIEPENIKALLYSNFEDYGVGSLRKNAFSPLLGNSILLSDGPQWEHARAMLRPSFTRSQVGDLATLEAHVMNLVKVIPRDGSTVDLGDLFIRYTADVTTDFMFGKSIESLSKQESFQAGLMQAFKDAQLGAEMRFRLGRFAKFVPLQKFHKAVKKVHAYMDIHVERAIEHRNLQKQSLDNQASREERYIFLDELSKVTRDRKVLRDELLTIFYAGRDTTSALLSNLFFILARDARVWGRLRAEIDHLNGDKPTLEQLKAMKYLGFCINEVLRLYPVIPGNSRIAIRDTIIPQGGGPDRMSPVFVPSGTLVIFHVYALHRRKDLWGSDAQDFRPERWETEKPGWKFLPFNAGPRNCIGQQFALNEAAYTTVRLMQEFSIIESRDARPWTEELGASCSSANGVKVSLRSSKVG